MAMKAGSLQREGEERDIGELGLKKKLLKAGLGYFKPETGDEVSGHCIVIPSGGTAYLARCGRVQPDTISVGKGSLSQKGKC